MDGPDGYISPRWYAKRDTVPTWNYVSVEAVGTVRKLDDDELDALAVACAGPASGGIEDAFERLWRDGFVREAAHHAALADDLGELHAPGASTCRRRAGCRTGR